MAHTVKILMTQFVTHDVKRFVVERPAGYDFLPGQATEVSINLPGYEKRKRPFTFTSLQEDRVLEFTIKAYADHDGVTKKLHELCPGDELIVRDVWGAITYKGPGVFLAAGAGVTPLLAILRRLRNDGGLAGNTMIFANKSARDVIAREELREMFGDGLILTLTREDAPGYVSGRVNGALLAEHVDDFAQRFYVCGPDAFVKDIRGALEKLGASAESIVFEA